MVEIGILGGQRAHAQVFDHSHARKNTTAFRGLRDAPMNNVVRRQIGNILFVEVNASTGRPGIAADGHQQGGLAGPVGADEGDDLALPDLDVDTLQGLDLTIKRMNALDVQHHESPPPGEAFSPVPPCRG